MWLPHFSADLVTIIEETLNGQKQPFTDVL